MRKLLGECSLDVLTPPLLARACDAASSHDALSEYVDGLTAALHAHARRARGAAGANSYGDSVAELALVLVCELLARPGDWFAFTAALAAEYARDAAFWTRADAAGLLRKKLNDLYAVLRDKVDSDNYQVACGRPCSPNRIYAYRMLDMAYAQIARLFDNWEANRAQVGAILGRELSATPIEVRQLTGIGACRAEWIERWSETLERFGDGPGPLHTRSKRFESLKGHPEKIQAMLAEIGEYETLSATSDAGWMQDEEDAAAWLDDLDRVLGEVSAPPGYEEAEDEARDWLARIVPDLSEPLRLAIYLKVVGPVDESYPPDWLDPASGELPTMQELAAREGVSLPTFRKRRDQALERLRAVGEQG
ncbi:MAG TPA: hypothetical protein VFF16_05545 [Telluria sp.]|nr:hypothetical protein [Telluria sp.]